jgi:deoxyhypusine synthase
MNFKKIIENLYATLSEETRKRIEEAVNLICETKRLNGKICVVTGSGPNIHEGVTTLIAELIHKGLVDAVLTSSAVVAHEMAGTLERVKRVDGEHIGIRKEILPKDGKFEISLLRDEDYKIIEREMKINEELMQKALNMDGDIIIKAAGNLSYPLGLRTEKIALEISMLARLSGLFFEEVAGLGADQRTMIGAGAQRKVPVLVTTPQLVGGGSVGIEIADSTPLRRRSYTIAKILSSSNLIIESAIALAQEIHDGPFETYTGHGIWHYWSGLKTFSLKDKAVIRIDLDPNLELAWKMERESEKVTKSIAHGLPKTKVLGIPFRMEMSGFSRLSRSLPIVGDIGAIWPIMAHYCSEKLGIKLDFLSFPQETEEGKLMREWIVKEIKILNREKIYEEMREKL